MNNENPLNTQINDQLSLEISTLREILSLEHQMEYAILVGDKRLFEQLNLYLGQNHMNLLDIHQKREELSIRLNNEIKNPGFFEEYESQALYEQLELLESKIDHQEMRNQALLKAIDADQSLSSASGLSIEPVYSKRNAKPIMLTVDYQKDREQNP